MLTLPTRITYNTLKSFWIVLNSVIFVLATVLTVYFTNTWLYLGLLLFIPVIVIPGVVNPEWILKPYIYVNAVLKRITRFLRFIVLLIVQYILLPSLRLTGTQLTITEFAPDGSMWKDKEIINLAGEKGEHSVSVDHHSASWWIISYCQWVKETKKWWLLTVVPFMLLLSVFSEDEKQKEVATDTYTLY